MFLFSSTILSSSLIILITIIIALLVTVLLLPSSSSPSKFTANAFTWPTDVPQTVQDIYFVENLQMETLSPNLIIDQNEFQNSSGKVLTFKDCSFSGAFSFGNSENTDLSNDIALQGIFVMHNSKIVFDNCRLSFTVPAAQRSASLILSGTSSFEIRNSIILITYSQQSGQTVYYGVELQIGSLNPATTSIIISGCRVEFDEVLDNQLVPGVAAIRMNLMKVPWQTQHEGIQLGQLSITNNSFISLPLSSSSPPASRNFIGFFFLGAKSLFPSTVIPSSLLDFSLVMNIDKVLITKNTIRLSSQLHADSVIPRHENPGHYNVFFIWTEFLHQVLAFKNFSFTQNEIFLNITNEQSFIDGATDLSCLKAGPVWRVAEAFNISFNIFEAHAGRFSKKIRENFLPLAPGFTKEDSIITADNMDSRQIIPKNPLVYPENRDFLKYLDSSVAPSFVDTSLVLEARLLQIWTLRSNFSSITISRNIIYADGFLEQRVFDILFNQSRFLKPIEVTNNDVMILKAKELSAVSISASANYNSLEPAKMNFDLIPTQETRFEGVVSFVGNRIQAARISEKFAGRGALLRPFAVSGDYGKETMKQEYVHGVEVLFNEVYGLVSYQSTSVDLAVWTSVWGSFGLKIHNNIFNQTAIGNNETKYIQTGESVPDTAAVGGFQFRSRIDERMEGGSIEFHSNNVWLSMDRGQGSAFVFESPPDFPTGKKNGSPQANNGRIDMVEKLIFNNTVFLKRVHDALISDLYFCGFAALFSMGDFNFGDVEIFDNHVEIIALGTTPPTGASLFVIIGRSNDTRSTVGIIDVRQNNARISSVGLSGGVVLSFFSSFKQEFFQAVLQSMKVKEIAGVSVTHNNFTLQSATSSIGAALGFSGQIRHIGSYIVEDNVLSFGVFPGRAFEAMSRSSAVWLGCAAYETPVFYQGNTFTLVVICNAVPEISKIETLIIRNNNILESPAFFLQLATIAPSIDQILLDNNTALQLDADRAINKITSVVSLDFDRRDGTPASRLPANASFFIKNFTFVNSKFGVSSFCGPSQQKNTQNSELNDGIVVNNGLVGAPRFSFETFTIRNIEVDVVCKANSLNNEQDSGKTKFTLVTVSSLPSIQKPSATGSSSSFMNVTQVKFSLRKELPNRYDAGVLFSSFYGQNLYPPDDSSQQTQQQQPGVSSSSSSTANIYLNNISIATTIFDDSSKSSSSSSSKFLAQDSLYFVDGFKLPSSSSLLSLIPASSIINYRPHCIEWNKLIIQSNSQVAKNSLVTSISATTTDAKTFTFDPEFLFCVPGSHSSTLSLFPSESKNSETKTLPTASASESSTFFDNSPKVYPSPLSGGAALGLNIASGLAGTYSAAHTAIRAIAINRIRSCFNESYRYQPLEVDANIFMMKISGGNSADENYLYDDEVLSSFRGGVVSQPIFAVMMGILFYIFSAAFYYYKKNNSKKSSIAMRSIINSEENSNNNNNSGETSENNNNKNIKKKSSSSEKKNNNNDEKTDEMITFLEAREFFRYPGLVLGPVFIVVGLPVFSAIAVLLSVQGKQDFDILLSIPSLLLFGIFFVGVLFWCAKKCDVMLTKDCCGDDDSSRSGNKSKSKKSTKYASKTEELVWTIEGFEQELKEREEEDRKQQQEDEDEEFLLTRSSRDKNNNNTLSFEHRSRQKKSNSNNKKRLSLFERELQDKIISQRRKEARRKVKERRQASSSSCFALLKSFLYWFRFKFIGYLIFESKEWKESSFVLQFGIIFDSYNIVLFCLIDYAVSAIVSILAGISLTCPERNCCTIVGSFTIAFCLGHAILILYFRPYLMRGERWANCVMVVVTFISSCLVLAELHDLNVTSILDTFAQVAVALSFLTVALGMQPLISAMAVVVWRIYKKRMRDGKKKKSGNGENDNSNSDSSTSSNDDNDDEDEEMLVPSSEQPQRHQTKKDHYHNSTRNRSESLPMNQQNLRDLSRIEKRRLLLGNDFNENDDDEEDYKEHLLLNSRRQQQQTRQQRERDYHQSRDMTMINRRIGREQSNNSSPRHSDRRFDSRSRSDRRPMNNDNNSRMPQQRQLQQPPLQQNSSIHHHHRSSSERSRNPKVSSLLSSSSPFHRHSHQHNDDDFRSRHSNNKTSSAFNNTYPDDERIEDRSTKKRRNIHSASVEDDDDDDTRKVRHSRRMNDNGSKSRERKYSNSNSRHERLEI